MPESKAEFFYGIRYSDGEDVNPPTVLPCNAEALKGILKSWKNRNPRFKIFRSREEAEEFASMKTEPRCEAPTVPTGNAECLFPSLSTQELASLRKDIEAADFQSISTKIRSNPRYLVSISTDTPSVLHSGTRSNALHVCARVGDPDITIFLLETLEDYEFLSSLYPKETQDFRRVRGDHLLDNYLNIPDKVLNETPLHIAAKYGHAEIVKILVSYSQCLSNPLNKNCLSPADIACSRSSNEKRKPAILDALEGRVYIPIYRSFEADGMIGDPWSPSSSKNLLEGSNFSPVRSPYRSSHKRSPLIVIPSNGNKIINSPLRVSGLLGPLSPKVANIMKREWKSSGPSLRIKDPDKGIERQGRILSLKYGVEWREYWGFLDAYADFRTRDGLKSLEEHLSNMSSQLESNKREQSFANLSYGFEEVELQSKKKSDPKSPISQLSDIFQSLNIQGPENDKSSLNLFDENKELSPLAKSANRGFEDSYELTESSKILEDLENLFDMISDQVLSNFKEEEDEENFSNFIVNVLHSPFIHFSRRVTLIQSEKVPPIYEDRQLLENLSISVVSKLRFEFSNEYVEKFLLNLKKFSESRDISKVESYNGGYRVPVEEDSQKPCDIDCTTIMPFCESLIQSMMTSASKKDLGDGYEESTSPSVNSFTTAESDSDRFSFCTAEEPMSVFILGEKPSRTDYEVHLALDGVDVSEYPYISEWKNCVEDYEPLSRESWPKINNFADKKYNIPKFDIEEFED